MRLTEVIRASRAARCPYRPRDAASILRPPRLHISIISLPRVGAWAHLVSGFGRISDRHGSSSGIRGYSCFDGFSSSLDKIAAHALLFSKVSRGWARRDGMVGQCRFRVNGKNDLARQARRCFSKWGKGFLACCPIPGCRGAASCRPPRPRTRVASPRGPLLCPRPLQGTPDHDDRAIHGRVAADLGA